MALKCGIVGLPNVGKSTLFNSLSSAKAKSANFPFCTIEPNVGTITVPDERINELAKIINPEKVVPTTIEIVDIAGLVKGASKGEGLGNQFLANIREVNAIIHVIRCFEDDNVIHVDGKVNPVNDKEVIDLELQLKDLETIEKRIDKQKKVAKSGNKQAQAVVTFLENLYNFIEEGRSAREYIPASESEEEMLNEMLLLTSKPIIYVCNVPENEVISGNKYTDTLKKAVANEKAEVMHISAKIESEIAELETYEERQEFIADMGLDEAGVNKLIKACYKLLNLITYFTAGVKEVRAWTINDGTLAPQAAGVIHSDFEKGFIKAKTVAYQDFITNQGWKGATDKGVMRQEGKEYLVKDGDLMEFMFNV